MYKFKKFLEERRDGVLLCFALLVVAALTPCLAPCEVLDKNPHHFLASGGDTFLTIPRPVKYQGL
jgi:hypothetical protein